MSRITSTFLYLLLMLQWGMMCTGAAAAQTSERALEPSLFRTLPVMHEGRIKPMDSFARALKKEFSGSETGASAWLVEALFNPARVENIPILKIRHHDVRRMLSLSARPAHLYTYQEVKEALAEKQQVLFSILDTPEQEWSIAQKNFVKLQARTVLLGDVLSSLSLFLPLSVSLPQDVPDAFQPIAGRALTYVEVLPYSQALEAEAQKIFEMRGENIQNHAPAEQAIIALSFALDNLQARGARSEIFRVIPGATDATVWQAPWQILRGEGGPQTSELFQNWAQLAEAYHVGDTDMWRTTLEDIAEKTPQLSAHGIREAALSAELYYNLLSPYMIATALYIAAFILAFFPARLLPLSALCLAGGILTHILAIGTRMYILERPPVSTLYESILFVALACAFYGLYQYIKSREHLWLKIGALLGGALSFVSLIHNEASDDLLMLSAVLDTNFWLATHVIIITLGYAFCLLLSLLAHIAIVKPEARFTNPLCSLCLIALLFTATGTLLGGIWADQSWGRFWGWDPKENGALLIVLWLIWLIHGRISAQMRPLVVNAGLAFTSVIVALSWFGVNLLGVGLHAYGFTDGAALGLFGFIGLEVMIISALVIYRLRRAK